ncbi:hypothetical protein FOMPIDRAFT_1080603, partial [Fomitopsis schrenkii]
LNVPDFAWFRPVQDRLDLRLGHGNTFRGEDIAKILDRLGMEFTLVCASVKVHDNTHIQEILKHFVDEALEHCRSV